MDDELFEAENNLSEVERLATETRKLLVSADPEALARLDRIVRDCRWLRWMASRTVGAAA